MNINCEDFEKLAIGGDGYFTVGKNGVEQILLSKDKKVEFIFLEDQTMAFVRSALGYPAFYPVLPVKIEKPVKAVLMDLDGTSVRSEDFWIWIIFGLLNNLPLICWIIRHSNLKMLICLSFQGTVFPNILNTVLKNIVRINRSKKPGRIICGTPAAK